LGSKFPIILGYDASGEVVETGSEVTNFQKGDQVYGRLNRKYGQAYAEYAIGSQKVFAKKPDRIPHEVAAAIPLAALTALQGLWFKGRIKEGQKVLIIGASGGVGHFALQLVKFFGGISTAVCSSKHEKMLNDLKPDFFIDYLKEDFKQSNEKYDIIFDVIGHESFLTCKNLLKPKGTYITTLPRPKVFFHQFLSLFTNRKKVRTFLMRPNGKDLDLLNKLILSNKFKVYIDKVYSLDQIADAHRYSESGKTEGKIVIKVTY
jgi:NADPH:quinone reductase-like Zn-dependent oxidoreductase